jgi:hypothetical protein
MDYHWKHQFRELQVELTINNLSDASVLDALRRGAFVGVVRQWRLPSDGDVAPELMQEFGFAEPAIESCARPDQAHQEAGQPCGPIPARVAQVTSSKVLLIVTVIALSITMWLRDPGSPAVTRVPPLRPTSWRSRGSWSTWTHWLMPRPRRGECVARAQ